MNPYSRLSPRAFWANQVGKPFYEEIWRPRIAIDPQRSAFASAGSCFSNHIGASLLAAGVAWHSHRPPEPDDKRFASFNLGNIYSVAQLRFWLAAALEPDNASLLSGGVGAMDAGASHCDLLRVGTRPDRFASVDEVIQDRQRALRQMAEILGKVDVFIFTLGLAEGWEMSDGAPCPICPAVRVEDLDPAAYRFVRYGYEEILSGLRDCLKLLRRLNPALQLLLTVSPVPLTATATDEHVLTATTEAKSVLRAAAAALVAESDGVDYFPSYEIVSTHLLPRDNFKRNRRDVSEDAVDFVMQHFFRGLGLFKGLSLRGGAAPTVAAPATLTGTDPVDIDEICDEAGYDNYRRNRDAAQGGSDIVLIGSSQIHMLSDALDLPHHLFTMNGSDFLRGHYFDDETDFFRPSLNDYRRNWLTFRDGGGGAALRSGCAIVVTDIGCQGIWLYRELNTLAECFQGDTPTKTWQVTAAGLATVIDKLRQRSLTLIQRVAAAGNRVIWVADPPFLRQFPQSIEAGLAMVVARYGVSEIIRPTEIAVLRDTALKGEDGLHGTPEYYRRLALEVVGRLPADARAAARR